jgi:hypothetical protein
MNLKKIGSFILAAAFALSVAAPSAMAADYASNVSVNESGSLVYRMNTSLGFDGVDVTNLTSATTSEYRNFSIDDSHSYSPGYKLTLSATPLTSGNYTIDNDNLSLNLTNLGPGTSCLLGSTDKTPVGGNTYQTVTRASGNQSLGEAFTLASAGEGRGCGNFAMGGTFTLKVPAGTYTGSDTATYSGKITLTNTIEAGG